uniref:Reverse transcriptase domain-containing protein n=1 Tax=Cannabis sativa TaxID=3483 RepID=A0A803PTY5_CANSA
MIFQDLLKGYTRKNVLASSIMKIDLSKAYDTVDSQFMEAMLSQLCFPSRFINWIMTCLKGTKYHLLMNDDLVLFSKGNLNSVKIIQEAFTKICNATGLSANKAKSQIFFGRVKDDIKLKILELVQIEEETFPLKYLGVNLRTTKWKASKGKKENRSKLHLASWEKVCLLKKLGGIGFREGKKWNKALIAKYLWAISSKQDNLWVKWINSIYLKGQSIWSYQSKQDTSWYFKKLLNIRVSTSKSSLSLVVIGKKFSASKYYNRTEWLSKLKNGSGKYIGRSLSKISATGVRQLSKASKTE